MYIYYHIYIPSLLNAHLLSHIYSSLHEPRRYWIGNLIAFWKFINIVRILRCILLY